MTNSSLKNAPLTKESINIEDYSVIKEGKAVILTPKEDKVFYNPIQQFNRDLSIMGIKAWTNMFQESKEFSKDSTKKRKIEPFINILEALSATGLRAIRYGHEIPHINKIVANDLLPEAVKSIDRNIVYNELTDKVVSNQGDAIKYMSQTNEKFHVIDLDPYGTATPFIDSALQSIKDDGILLVTCTDAGVLAGSGYPEKCFALYGGSNFGNTYMGSEANHEVGLRLILSMIANTAAKYKKTIEPMLSLSIDFYFRLFIRVKTSPIEVKKLASKTMITYHCIGCGDKHVQPLGRINENKYQTPKMISNISSHCTFCESNFNIAGPMWLGKIHNRDFVERILSICAEDSDSEVYGTKERVKGMLTLAKNELDDPFYFNLNQLSSFFKSPPIPINDFVKAIGNLGYDVSLTHAKKNCIKTNAPWEDILQVNKQWLINCNEKNLLQLKENPNKLNEKIKAKIDALEANLDLSPNLKPTMIGYKILINLRESAYDKKINFVDETPISTNINKLRKLKMVRYQENPTKNWGPKARPSSS